MSMQFQKSAASQLADVTLPEEAYSADLQVNERAQVFTTEIVRLALLAIAGVGFLMAEPQGGNGLVLRPVWLLFVGLLFLGAAVGLALLHRYFSTDCIVCQIAILRLLKRLEAVSLRSDVRTDLEKKISLRRSRQEKDMFFCRWFTFFAATSLAMGALCIATLLAYSYTA